MDPIELRRQASAFMAQAQSIFDAVRSANREATEAEETRHDELVANAQTLVTKAAGIEGRNQRFSALQSALQDVPGRTGDPLPHNDPSNSRNGRHGYSAMKAIRQLVERRDGTGGGLDGIEAETHQELVNRRGRPARGVLIPWDLAVSPRSLPSSAQYRATGTVDTTAGTGAITTGLGPMIDLLRARMVISGLGATFMADMDGKFALPRQNQSATGYWVAEGGAPSTSNQTIDQVPFEPRTAGGFTDYTRKFLAQTSIGAENWVRDDLTRVVALAVESAALNGTGSSNQPKGILQYGGTIGTVAIGATGGNPTWAHIVAMESAVAAANADIGTLAYCFNAVTRGYLKGAPKISGYPQFIWDTNGGATPVNGYGAAVTNLLPSTLAKSSSGNILSAGIFGNWADLVVATWGGLDVMLDPISLGTSGGNRIIVLQDADVNLRHPESFCICSDIKTT